MEQALRRRLCVCVSAGWRKLGARNRLRLTKTKAGLSGVTSPSRRASRTHSRRGSQHQYVFGLLYMMEALTPTGLSSLEHSFPRLPLPEGALVTMPVSFDEWQAGPWTDAHPGPGTPLAKVALPHQNIYLDGIRTFHDTTLDRTEGEGHGQRGLCCLN